MTVFLSIFNWILSHRQPQHRGEVQMGEISSRKFTFIWSSWLFCTVLYCFVCDYYWYFFISPSSSPPLCCPCALSQIGCPRRSPMIDCLFPAVSSPEFVDWRTMIKLHIFCKKLKIHIVFRQWFQASKVLKMLLFCSNTGHGSPEGEVPLY